MKTPGDQRPHCPACGLHEPCKTCGGGGKPRLGIVPAAPAERESWPLVSRSEVLAAMRKAFDAGLNAGADAQGGAADWPTDAGIAATLEGLLS